MDTKSKSRTISLSDTSLLITNAGGRCSYNDNKEYCNKVLSDGRVNLGERAHIIGVNGPRASILLNGNKNGYDNLIWLCRDHHKIIDHSENLDQYSVEVLGSRGQPALVQGAFKFKKFKGSASLIYC